MIDVNQDVVDKGFASIQKSIGRVAKKKNMSDDEVAAIVGRITPSTEVASAGIARALHGCVAGRSRSCQDAGKREKE